MSGQDVTCTAHKPHSPEMQQGMQRPSWLLQPMQGCDILSHGLIGLIEYPYQQQLATYFPEAHLKKTSRLSVLGLERFDDG